MNGTEEVGVGTVTEEAGSSEAICLTVDNLSVRFGGITAVRGAGLTARPNEIVAVVGPNGAGKSTLLNAISGLVAYTGHVAIGARSLDGMPAFKRAEMGLSRSFQDPQLIERYTVQENVMCGAHFSLRYRLLDEMLRPRHVRSLDRATRQRADQLIDLMGLHDVANNRAGSLPYGARKLIDICRAVMAATNFLLLDEPSSGLDDAERSLLEETLLSLRQLGQIGLLIVEHHMDLVRSVATQVVGMQAGQVLMTGSPGDVLDAPAFRAAIVGTASSDPTQVPLVEELHELGEAQ